MIPQFSVRSSDFAQGLGRRKAFLLSWIEAETNPAAGSAAVLLVAHMTHMSMFLHVLAMSRLDHVSAECI